MRRYAFLLLVSLSPAGALAAQDAATPAVVPPHRDRLAFSAGLITGMPGQGERGAGPFLGVTLRTPTKKEGQQWLLGVGYGMVFTDGWTTPEGEQLSYTPEGLIGALGREWALGERESIGFDLQWNPSVTRVRRGGATPAWLQDTSPPWTSTVAVGSLGLRLTLPSERGPVVSIAGRFYMHLHPLALAYGAVAPMPAIGVSIQQR